MVRQFFLTAAVLCVASSNSATAQRGSGEMRAGDRHFTPGPQALAPVRVTVAGPSATTTVSRVNETVDDLLDVDEMVEEVEAPVAAPSAPAYDLQIASMRGPIPEYAADGTAHLWVDVTIKNTGRVKAPVARLLLGEEDGAKHNVAEKFVPAVPAGGSVTIRVPVGFPTNADGKICFTGEVEPIVRAETPALDTLVPQSMKPTLL